MTPMDSDHVKRSIGQASERLHAAMREAAERIAGEIRAEAEAEAQSYADQRRREADEEAAARLEALSEVAATLTAHIDRVRIEAEALSHSLEEATGRLRAMQGEVTSIGDAAGPAPTEPTVDAGMSREAVLRATQMAAAGSERREIEDALREEFSVRDPGLVTDRILGPA